MSFCFVAIIKQVNNHSDDDHKWKQFRAKHSHRVLLPIPLPLPSHPRFPTIVSPNDVDVLFFRLCFRRLLNIYDEILTNLLSLAEEQPKNDKVETQMDGPDGRRKQEKQKFLCEPDLVPALANVHPCNGHKSHLIPVVNEGEYWIFAIVFVAEVSPLCQRNSLTSSWRCFVVVSIRPECAMISKFWVWPNQRLRCGPRVRINTSIINQRPIIRGTWRTIWRHAEGR